MITVYEIKQNGFLGQSKQIDPKTGVDSNWTYTPPPDNGVYQWVNSTWVSKDEEPNYNGSFINEQDLANSIRELRNELLLSSDWTQTLDAPVDRNAWADYRQKLRDITKQETFPWTVSWPEKP